MNDRLPKDVLKVKRILTLDPSDERSEVAKKLIKETPELIAMWRALEKRSVGSDDLWVWSFLSSVRQASALPRFHYKNKQERREISDYIARLSKNLAIALESNDLDGHLTYNNGVNFNGFFLYEDFSHSNQSYIDEEQLKKLPVSLVIQKIAERAIQKLADEPLPGKAGRNAHAIRFVRIISERNTITYSEALHQATAAAVNAIYDTCYQESDIVNLLKRAPLQS